MPTSGLPSTGPSLFRRGVLNWSVWDSLPGRGRCCPSGRPRPGLGLRSDCSPGERRQGRACSASAAASRFACRARLPGARGSGAGPRSSGRGAGGGSAGCRASSLGGVGCLMPPRHRSQLCGPVPTVCFSCLCILPTRVSLGVCGTGARLRPTLGKGTVGFELLLQVGSRL